MSVKKPYRLRPVILTSWLLDIFTYVYKNINFLKYITLFIFVNTWNI